MKKSIAILVSLLLVVACMFSACTVTYVDPTDNPTQAGDPTIPPTQVPTEAPTEAPTKAPKVYTPGVPSEFSESIFLDEFDENGQIVSEDAFLRYPKSAFICEKGYFKFNANYAQYYMTKDSQEFLDEVVQYEYYVKFNTEMPSKDIKSNPADWFCPFFGVRVYDIGDGYNPVNEDSGIWLAIYNDKTTEGKNYAGFLFGGSNVDKPAVKLELPEYFRGEDRTLVIVDANGLINYYMDSANDEELHLFATVDMTGDNIIVKNAKGVEVYSQANNYLDGGTLQEGMFKVFNHFGATNMDYVEVKVLEK